MLVLIGPYRRSQDDTTQRTGMEETSLEEFLASEAEEQDEDSDTAIERATVTSQINSERTECEVCESFTARLWNDEESFVCHSCKEW